MIRAVVIDDEEKARITLVNYLTTYCTDLTIVSEAESVETGIVIINQYQPDVVFLDIMLSDGSGFTLLKKLKQINFKIVFVTSYSQYAIKAFKFSAFDYLLKPIDVDELIDVINRLKTITKKEDTPIKLDFIDSIIHQQQTIKKIVLSTHNNLHLVDIDDIIHCEAQENYTAFYLNNETKILVSKTLKEFEQLLQEHLFIRTHKSHLINFKFISRFTHQDGENVILKNGAIIPVSVRKKETLIALINKLGLK